MSAFSARRSDPTTKAALRRVLVDRLRSGLGEIEAHGHDASMHELRKRTKELRGLVRMLRPGFGAFACVNGQLRDAALSLSPARDAETMLDNFDGLTAGLRDPSAFSGLRARLLAEIATRRAQTHAQALPEYAQVLTGLTSSLAKLKLSDKASRVIWVGLHKTWEKARSGYRKALASYETDFDAAPFHNWRKSVKHHWYQARFLRSIAPRKMAPHIARIDELGEVLGDHNDLDVLIRFLEAQETLSDTDQHARTIFIRHAMKARRSRARHALALGRRALAPAPEKLVGKWQHWWRRWRNA